MRATPEKTKVFDIYNSLNQRLATVIHEALAKKLAGTKFTIRERIIDVPQTNES
jgi:hypothetical protein